MPVFTAIGLALGVSAAWAAAAGVAATALVGAAGYAAAGGFSDDTPAPVDSRVSAATGELTEAEAQTQAKKRLYRSGVLFTSPTGLDETGKTSSAKLR